MDTGLQIKKLGASLGAEIVDFNLNEPLQSGDVATIQQALRDHLVLVFRNQQLSPESYIEFGRQFGELIEHPVFPHLEGYPPIIEIKNFGKQFSVNEHWHSDVTFSPQPSGETMLYALDIPETGGDTQFSNQYLAYDALSDGMKDMLGRMRAVHTGAGAAKLAGKDASEAPTAVHPVIRTHPVTGKKALFVCRAFTEKFEGMTWEESQPLLNWLFDHSARYEFTWRHQWQPGDVAIWDNRCTLHYAIHDHGDENRLLHRCTTAGEAVI